MAILVIIGFLLASAAWQTWGPIPGLLVGFLFMGGVGWKWFGAVLLAIWTSLNYALRPGMYGQSKEFIAAWEARFGPMVRGDPYSQPPPGMFPTYFRLWKRTGISAEEFVRRL